MPVAWGCPGPSPAEVSCALRFPCVQNPLDMLSKSLYSISMKTLGNLLGSAARTEILRVMSYQSQPIGLRHLARLADIYPRSAELALKALVQEELLLRTQIEKRVLYELNRDHPSTPVLLAIFRAVDKANTSARCNSLKNRAKAILPALRDATRLLRNTRSMQHAT
jgi:hypothetical protein